VYSHPDFSFPGKNREIVLMTAKIIFALPHKADIILVPLFTILSVIEGAILFLF